MAYNSSLCDEVMAGSHPHTSSTLTHNNFRELSIDSSQPALLSSEARPTSAATRRATLWILATALVARVVVLLTLITSYPHKWFYTHGIEMGLLADSLVHGHGYSSPFGGSTGPSAFIAPGYPTLIAAIFSLTGTYSFASVIAIICFQTLVTLTTLWLILWIARQLIDERAAIIAGVIWAISLPIIWVPTIFWETSLSECMLTGLIALAWRLRRGASLRTWILLGAYCAIAALFNPALLPALLAILGWLAYKTRKQARLKPLAGLLALLILFSPWPIRNAVRFHAFIPLRSTVGFELWMGNRPGATGYLDEKIFPMFNQQELATYVQQGEVAYTHNKTVAALSYIRQHPEIFLRMTARRIFRFWTGTGNSSGSIFYALHATFTTFFGALGLFLLFRSKNRSFALLMLLPLLLFPLPYYITHAEFRYRLVIDPLMTLMAGYALSRTLELIEVPPDQD